jgi:competence protein ComEC
LLAAGGLLWTIALATVSRKPGLSALALLGGAACAGGLVLAAATAVPGSDVSRLLPRGAVTLVGRVADPPRPGGDRWHFTLSALAAGASRRSRRVTGEAFVYASLDRPLARGDLIEITGRLRPVRRATNPGETSRYLFLIARGIRVMLEAGDPRLIRKLQTEPAFAEPWTERARARVLDILRGSLPAPNQELEASLLGSLLFGLRAAPLPGEVNEAFRRAGTIHVLVVSGTQLSLLFAVVFLPGWLAGLRNRGARAPGHGGLSLLPGRLALLLVLGLISFYALLVGGGQSVVRAAIMAGLTAAALLLLQTERISLAHGLNLDRYTLLALAGLAILVFAPLSLFDIGFQLSFAAVWGLCYLVPLLSSWLAWLPGWIRLTAAATTSAQLATAPILIWHFHTFPAVGFLANLVIVPLATVLLFLGLGTCLLGALSPAVARFSLGWVSSKLMGAMLSSAHFFAAAPAGSPRVYFASPLEVAACYGALGLAAELLRRASSSRSASNSAPTARA